METVIFRSPHPPVPLRHREGEPRAVSWGGMSFPPDEDGINWLPVEAVKEMTESHGMVGAATDGPTKSGPQKNYIAELEAEVAKLKAKINELEARLAAPQTTEGGAVRPTVFPPQGAHPMGGKQPALGPPPDENEVKASQSEPVVKAKK